MATAPTLEPNLITIERNFDTALARKIITHPQVYPNVTDDFSPPAEEFEVPPNPCIFQLLAKHNNEPFGLFMLIPQTFVCWEIHTFMLPKAWGKWTADAGKAALRWMFENTPCQRIISNIPEYDTRTLLYALKVFSIYGVNPTSYLKNGKLHNQILVGINKGDFLCQ